MMSQDDADVEKTPNGDNIRPLRKMSKLEENLNKKGGKGVNHVTYMTSQDDADVKTPNGDNFRPLRKMSELEEDLNEKRGKGIDHVAWKHTLPVVFTSMMVLTVITLFLWRVIPSFIVAVLLQSIVLHVVMLIAMYFNLCTKDRMSDGVIIALLIILLQLHVKSHGAVETVSGCLSFIDLRVETTNQESD